MNETSPPEGNLGEELRSLGENLKSALHSAWESEERKKVQAEIETGLADLSQLLKDTAEEFEAEKIGKGLKAEVENFREQIESGEVAAQVRTDLVQVLQAINNELTKIQDQWTTGSDTEADDE
jgi:hypothetical protein